MSKVSVIIPIFNGAKFLQECLNSALQQSISDIEIICINDGSTDNTLQILKEYAEVDRRIKIINQSNLGVSVARNKGIKAAISEYVCFLDADDLYPNNTTLELLYKTAKKENALICGGSMRQFDEKGSWDSFEGIYTKYTFNKYEWIEFKNYQFNYGYQRFIFKRTLLIENKIFFPLYKRYQDPPFFVESMVKAKQFYAVPEVTYCYRLGHQTPPVEWPIEKLEDLVKGWTHNLAISRRENMPELHKLILGQVEDDYTAEALKKSISLDNQKLVYLLIKLNCEIDFNLLESIGANKTRDSYYLIRSIIDFLGEVERNKYELIEAFSNKQYDYNQMKNSISFRIGRIVTFIPRQVRDCVRCYRDNGFLYTMKKVEDKINNLLSRKGA